MLLFLVQITGYDENTICGIFSTLEGARECLRATESFWADSRVLISQLELDQKDVGIVVERNDES